MLTSGEKPLRRIKSFVLRQGRLTPGQQKAFVQTWPRVGVEYRPELLDLPSIFGNDKPVIVEIGFGNGDSLAQMALAHPDNNYLGIEVHRPGVGHLLIEIERLQIDNIRTISHDAIEVLQHCLADSSLAGVQLFFPDPWHKKRHHKRRIVQPDFLDLLCRLIKPGGFFHAATDWQDYAQHMQSVIQQHACFSNRDPSGFSQRPPERPLTKFEQRGQRLGHGVWDLIADRV